MVGIKALVSSWTALRAGRLSKRKASDMLAIEATSLTKDFPINPPKGWPSVYCGGTARPCPGGGAVDRVTGHSGGGSRSLPFVIHAPPACPPPAAGTVQGKRTCTRCAMNARACVTAIRSDPAGAHGAAQLGHVLENVLRYAKGRAAALTRRNSGRRGAIGLADALMSFVRRRAAPRRRGRIANAVIVLTGRRPADAQAATTVLHLLREGSR